MREIIIVGRFCRTRVSSNGKLRTEKALLRAGRRGCERDCAGEVRRGRAERNRTEGNDGFRLLTFLLELHSPSRSRDTASVSLTLDTFTPELSPSGTLGVQAPLRGRLAGSDTFRSLSRQRQRVFPTADLLIASALPVPKQRHLIRLADARHLPLQGEGLRGAIRFVTMLLHYRFFDRMDNYCSQRLPLGGEAGREAA